MRNPFKPSGQELVTREFAVGMAHAAADARERQMLDMPKPTVDEHVPSGTYGIDDSWYADLLAGGPDVNPLLSGRAKYEVYNEMRLSDPTVRSCLWMFKLPIRSASWKIEAASEDPVDEVVADCVEWQFGLGDYEDDGRLDKTWDESLQQALLFLDWGAMFEEIVWGEPELWYDDDGDPHLIRPINRLAPRFPSSVIRASHDTINGGLDWIEQDLPGARPIPGDKLCHYALDLEGYNWWGVSLLRPMYGPWRLKKALMIAAGIGWDRHAVGTPIVRYPTGGGNAARMQAEQIARSYRVHERGYVAFEGPKPGPGNTATNLWDMEIMNGSNTLADPVHLLREYDIQIATAGLQMFARLGQSATGSRAVGEVLSDPFYLAVQAIAKHVASIRIRRAIRRFVDVNFGPEVETPKISVSKIQAKNVPVLARAIADLSSAGLSFEDPDTQNDIRDQLDLDHLPEDVAAALEGLPPKVGLSMPTEQIPGSSPEDDPTNAGIGVATSIDATGGVTTGAV